MNYDTCIAKSNILLVDDGFIQQFTLKKIIVSTGFAAEINACRNGKEA